MKKIILIIAMSLFLAAYPIGPKEYYKAVSSKPLVVVKFWAPWCGICHTLEPEYKKAKSALKKEVLFLEYNYDKGPEFAQNLNIIGLPTMILYKNGKEVDRLIADATKDEIIEWIQKYK